MLFLRQQVNKIYKPLFLKECLPRNAVNTLVFYSPFSVCEKGLCLYTNSQEVNLMPSAKILADKQARVAEITEMLKNATSGVIVDYKGISVEADTKLRKDLREAGVNYFVVKNSILRFAVKEAGLEELADVLTGSTAIAVSEDDAIAPARILVKAAEVCKTSFKGCTHCTGLWCTQEPTFNACNMLKAGCRKRRTERLIA